MFKSGLMEKIGIIQTITIVWQPFKIFKKITIEWQKPDLFWRELRTIGRKKSVWVGKQKNNK